MSQAQNTDVTLKKTILHPLHGELGGRLVAFAGYELPVQFRGIREEHLHTRAHASLFDISHMGQIMLRGARAAESLERLVPSRLTDLRAGQQRYTVLLNEAAGIIDDLIVTRLDDDTLFLIVNAACRQKDLACLRAHLGGKIIIEELPEQALIALQGPAAAATLAGLGIETDDLAFMQAKRVTFQKARCLFSRSGYTGEDGFEISIPNEHATVLFRDLLAQPHVQPAGLGARDTLRLEAGLCLYGHELSEEITPVTAGLNWILDRERLQTAQSCTGGDVILRQLNEGTPRQRVGILVEGKVPVREGTELLDQDDNIVGRVTSGSYSPCLEKPVAMAYVNADLCHPGTGLNARVRQRLHPVQVARLPFVPHRYSKQKQHK